ncbi:hypothetical protein HP532_15635 [Pseudomonas sp. CrR25]|nr:hypothetical protein [Pseudomonas sp. CrR25]
MKRLDNLENEVDQFINRVFKHVPPDSKDSTIIVLKGHLLSEELMNDLINKILPHPEHIKNCRFNYSQTLSLAKAVSDDERHDKWVWSGLKKLNDIRNAYSHNLEPEKINDKEAEFTRFIEEYTSKGVRDGYTELASAVLHLLTALLAICMLVKNNAK